MGWQIVGIPEGMALGAINIDDNAADVAESIRALAREHGAREHGARAVFGVFPTPLLALGAAVVAGVSIPFIQRRAKAGFPPLPARWHKGWQGKETTAPQKVDLAVCMPLFASHNVSRTPEGGKPTFYHKAWHTVSWLPF
jgi:hypothetical protein